MSVDDVKNEVKWVDDRVGTISKGEYAPDDPILSRCAVKAGKSEVTARLSKNRHAKNTLILNQQK